MTTFLGTALLMAVKLVNKSAASIALSDAPRAPDNLSKLLDLHNIVKVI